MANEYDIIIRAQDKTGRTIRNVENSLDRLEAKSGAVTRALGVAGAALASFGAGNVLRGVVSTTRAFERYNTMLTTYLGSQRAANLEMSRLQTLANNLPQDLEDITKAFVIFTRTGIDTGSEALAAFSNIATANGKSLEQLGEAVADALTGEFERLKEFGIKVSKENDQFVADIGNGNQIIANSARDLVTQLQALGEEGGKFGDAASINAQTLDQSFSNLAGAVFETQVAFGEGLKPELKAVVEQTSLLLRNNQELAKQFGANLGDAIRTAANGLALIGQNIDVIRNAMLTFIGIRSAQYFATIAKRIAQLTAGAKTSTGFISGMGNAIRGLTIAPIASLARFIGPQGLIAAGALAVGYGLRNLANQTVQLGSVQATFGQVASAAWSMFKEGAVNAFNNALTAAGNFYNTLANSQIVQDIAAAWEEYAKFVGGVFTAIAGYALRRYQDMVDATAFVINKAQEWFGILKTFATNKFAEILQAVINWAAGAQDAFITWYDKVSTVVGEVVSWFQWAFGVIADYAKNGINFIINSFVAMGEFVKGLAENIPQYFGAMFRGIMNAAGDFATAITSKFSNIGEAIGLALTGDFSGAMAKAGEEVGYSFTESIQRSFADVGSLLPTINYSEIFATDRVDQAVRGLASQIRIGTGIAAEGFQRVQDAVDGMLSSTADTGTVLGATLSGIRSELDMIQADFERGSQAIDNFISPETLEKIQNLGQTLVDMLPDEVADNLEDKLMRLRQAQAYEEYARTRLEADELRRAQEELAAATADVVDSIEDIPGATDKATNGLEDLKREATTVSGIVKETWGEMSKNMSRGIAESIMAGKGAFNSFKDYLKSFANEVMTKILDRMLIQPLMNQMTNMLGLTNTAVPTIAQQFGGMFGGGGMGGGMGGFFGGLGNMFSGLWGGITNFASGLWGGISGFFGNLFGGFFADGGYLPAGKVGVVGEAGPELITGPANITPMDDTGSGAVTVNFNINAISTQDATEFIMKNKQQITGVIQDAYNRRGRQGVY